MTTPAPAARAAATAARPVFDLDGSDAAARVDGDVSVLSGGRCAACGALFFPSRSACFECGGLVVDRVDLDGSGTLYSATTIRVSATMPTPYTLGYVDLDNGLRLLAPFAGDVAQLEIGGRVHLTVGADGAWCYAPDPTATQR